MILSQAAASHEACRNVTAFYSLAEVGEQVGKGRGGTDPVPEDFRKGGLESQARVKVESQTSASSTPSHQVFLCIESKHRVLPADNGG